MGHTAEQGENVKLVKNANIFTLLIVGHSASLTKILWLTKVKHVIPYLFLARYVKCSNGNIRLTMRKKYPACLSPSLALIYSKYKSKHDKLLKFYCQ